ncbi:AMP-binding protein [Stappia stellulata]|uniref:AMP-binding protein n=1 Tax=Stappia stellulata TaxID=71235 RepID=UPI0003F8B402|nr:AMP-binding protein [Stappia stellulata]
MAFVGDTLERHARLRANDEAVVCGKTRVSWQDLLDETCRVEEALARHEQPQARIGISTREPFDAICLVLAVARSGRVAVVADPATARFPAEELAASLSFRFWSLAEIGTRADSPGPCRNALAPVDPSGKRPEPPDPFYIGLTSGSTGQAKAFQRSHASWLTSFAACEAAFSLSRDDRIAVPGSLSHSLHLFGAVHALHMGARLDLSAVFRPRSVLQAMVSAGSTVLYATPTQLDLLVRAARGAKMHLPDVKRVLLSGAKWHSDGGPPADVFPAARFHEFYGTSETSFISTRGPQDPASSVGRPFPGVEVDIRDVAGRSLSTGEAGLIHVASAMIFDRYVHGGDPDTRRDGKWLSVGDWGFLDEGGRLHLLGRGSRMLVCAGVNVFAEEIEAVLLAHGAVAACAVFGRPDPLRGQRIVAAIRATDGAEAPAPDLLRRHCLAHLDPIKVPRRFHVMQDWPLTGGGKPDLVVLAQRVAELEAVA